MRFARFALVIPVAALAVTTSCLNDRPVNGLGGNAAVALRVVAPNSPPSTGAALGSGAAQTVEIIIGIGCYNCAVTGNALAPGVLYDQRFPVGNGLQRIAATFPFAPCAGYFPNDNLGPYCDVQVAAVLRSDTVTVSTQYLNNVRIRPGVVTQTDSVYFGALTTGGSVRGVKVEAGLVWYAMNASSAFGGIASSFTYIFDSTGYASTSIQFFDPIAPSIGAGSPALYAVVGGTTAAQYQSQVVDIHGNYSYPPETQGIDPPNANVAPYVYALTSDTTPTTLTVSATGFSVLASTKQIDFVVRNVPNQYLIDTVYMVCSVPAPGQFSTASGSCPRTGPRFTAALVVAVPVDSTSGVGFGASCGLGLICNYGTIYPQRRR